MRSFIFNPKNWRTSTDIKNWLPTLQSHRGYWVEGLQQNTMASIQKSFSLGFQMVEFDVRLTRDEKVVLFHDEHFQGKKLSSLYSLDLKKQLEEKQMRLDSLEDLFIWFANEKKNSKDFTGKLNIEIKSKHALKGTLDKKVVQLVEQYDLTEHCLISSFNPMTLFRIKKWNSSLRRALLLTESEESNVIANNMWLNSLCQPDVLHLRFQDFKPEKYAVLSRHIPIVLWTVNQVSVYEKNQDYVHGIISDSIRPDQF